MDNQFFWENLQNQSTLYLIYLTVRCKIVSFLFSIAYYTQVGWNMSSFFKKSTTMLWATISLVFCVSTWLRLRLHDASAAFDRYSSEYEGSQSEYNCNLKPWAHTQSQKTKSICMVATYISSQPRHHRWTISYTSVVVNIKLTHLMDAKRY